MGSENGIGLFFGGLTEGFVLPLIELIIAILISTTTQIIETTSVTEFNLGLALALFGLMNILENLLIGFLGNIFYIIGYCIGAIFGILIFFGYFSNVFPEARSATIGVVVLIMLGILLRFGIYIKFSSNDY